jgi:hypothetical protein
MTDNREPYWNLTWPPATPEAGESLGKMQERAVLLAGLQLDELARLKAVAMGWVDRLEGWLDGKIDAATHPAFTKSRGFINDLDRVARIVRQIMVLEREVAGLRPSRRRPADDSGGIKPDRRPGPRKPRRRGRDPNKDDTVDFHDFRPVGETVGWIRESLGVDAPANDPFNAPRRATAKKQPPADTPPEPEAPEQAAAESAPAVTQKRARSRAYDLDFRDQAGKDLTVAPTDADPTARGPP